MGMNFAIIGCGLIGNKRAAAIKNRGRLVVAADLVRDRAVSLARPYNAEATDRWEKAIAMKDVDVVIVATTHDQLAPIALAAVQAGKHLLLEKPGGRRPGELDPLIEISREKRRVVHVGFNHRFHPAILKAHELIKAGELGELYSIRGRYGHGGRIGYEKEWRANPSISGGGELLDQGAHLIDLSLYFFEESFESVYGLTQTYFWEMPVEDNGFLLLKTKTGKIAHLQVSWTEWKNLFSFEITGRKGKLHIEGLGGSYGVERLTYYKMKPEMGPPETAVFEYPSPDLSWETELDCFVQAIQNGKPCQPGLDSTREVLSIIENVYRQNHSPWVTRP